MAALSPINKLTLSLTLDQVSFAILIVILFPHLTSLGASQLYMGSTMSVMSLIGLIWNPIIGSLGDTYGRKLILKRLLTIGATSTVLMMISNSLVIIFIARLISGFAGPLIPIVNSLASDILEKDDQKSLYGRLPTLMAINMIVGPLLGGFISEFNHGYLLCYILILLLILMNIGVVSTLPDIKQEKKKEESVSLLEAAKQQMKIVVTKLTNVEWNEYSDIFTAKLCIELTCSLFFQSIGPSYFDFGIQGRALGYIFTFMSVNTIVANVLLGNMKKTVYAEDNFGKKRLFHSAAIFVITALVLSYSYTIITFSSGIFLMSVGKTIADNTFTEALMAKVTDKDRGGVSGAFESIVSFCGLVTPVAGGLLIDSYGMKFILKMSLIPAIVGFILTYRGYRMPN